MFASLLLIIAQVTAPAATAAPAAPIVTTDGFTVGVDDFQGVTAKLGKPSTVTHNSDGTTEAIYASHHTKVKGATFIPVVGLFAGGAKGRVITKTYVFDQSGKLKTASDSETNVNCSTGFGGVKCK